MCKIWATYIILREHDEFCYTFSSFFNKIDTYPLFVTRWVTHTEEEEVTHPSRVVIHHNKVATHHSRVVIPPSKAQVATHLHKVDTQHL